MLQSVQTSSLPGDTARTLIDAVSCYGDGTWRLLQADQKLPEILIQIEDQRIVDLQVKDQPNVLVRALIQNKSLPGRERTRLEKQAAELGVCPGVLCLEEGLFDGNSAAELIGQVVDDYLVPVLKPASAIWSGPDQQPIETGLRYRVDLGQSIEEVLLRSARRHQLWESIADLPLLREVVAATPSAIAVITNPEETSETRTLLEAATGFQDLAEIAESTSQPWQSLDRLLQLLSDGYLETQSSMELFQAGESLLSDQQPNKALRRWRSAEEKGLDDFDLGSRIGRTCAVTGRIAEADRRLRAHAQRCSDQLRIDAARDAWSGVAALNPDDREARQRAIALWQREPGDDPALCLELAQALLTGQQADAACQLLDSVGAYLPDPRIHAMHEEAANHSGDPEASHKARWRQAEALRACQQWDEAAEHYRFLATQQRQTPLLLLRLTEISLEKNDPIQARQYCIQALTGSEGEDRPLDVESRQALEDLADRTEAPSDLQRWIADHHQRAGDVPQEAIARQRQYRAHQREQDLSAACEAARRSQLLQPGNLTVALDHARLVQEAGDLKGSISLYEQILQNLPEGHPQEEELTQTLLQHNPGNRTALERTLARTPEDSPQHRAIKLRLALLSMLQGDRSTAATATTSESMLLEVLSALIDGTETALGKLQTVAERLLQKPDPLVEVVREVLGQVNPDHPLLHAQTAIPATPDSSRGAVVRTGIGGITAKLKNVQTHEKEAVSAPAPSSPTSEKDESQEPEAAKGIQSALDRLRSLRGTSAPESVTPSSEKTENTEESVENCPDEPNISGKPPAAVGSEEVQSAAARLGALRGEASGS